MKIEKYFHLIREDMDAIENTLREPMPDQVRQGLEDELSKLNAMDAALSGSPKSNSHSLRARLRWARQRLLREKDAKERKKIESEISEIEGLIDVEVAKGKGRK